MPTWSELLPEIRKCCCDRAAFERLLKLLFEIVPPDHHSAIHALAVEAESNSNHLEIQPNQSAIEASWVECDQQPDLQSDRLITLGQLMAGTAHEINNPVNFVYGNLFHLQQYVQDLTGILDQYRQELKLVDPERGAQLKTMEHEMDLDFLLEDLPKTASSMRLGLERVRTIVNSLKNFSRADDHQPRPFNLNDSLTSSLLILHHRLKVRSDGLIIQVIENYADLPPVECLVGQINQVFINILGNAIDALEDHQIGESFQPIITLSTKLDESGDRVVIAIADNGPGIPPAVQAKLFDRFFTTKPLGKGTGLGLSIVREIITEHHEGQVTCHATDAGTTFEITLPIRHRLATDPA